MSFLRVVAVLVLAAGGAACDRSPAADEGKISVVASFYPLAEAAQRASGDWATVTNLTPAGVEPHDLELAPDDLEVLVTADVVVYLGGGFQPAVEDGIDQAEGATIDALEVAGELRPPGEGEEEELTADPHVWLDPSRYAMIVDAVAEGLAEADPTHADEFRSSAELLRGELSTLDREFADGLRTCRSRMIVTNHAAFGYLAEAYGLEQVAISGLSPEAEVDPARIAELRDLVEREGITTIFTEELASPEVARTLANEAGVQTATLSPLEGLSKEELDAGEDYASVMRTNLERLREALGCS